MSDGSILTDTVYFISFYFQPLEADKFHSTVKSVLHCIVSKFNSSGLAVKRLRSTEVYAPGTPNYGITNQSKFVGREEVQVYGSLAAV